VGVLHRGPWWKSDLFIVDLGDGPMVVKDFAGKFWLSRLAGRFQIDQECRAYRRLGPLPCVPAFLGRVDAYAMAIEKIEGDLLTDSPNRFTDRRTHLRRIRRVIDQLAAIGFAHLDMRARRNVLLRPDGKIVVVDFAGAVWWRPGSFGYRLFESWMRWWYQATLLKWKKLLTKGISPREGKTFRYHRGFIDLVRALRLRRRPRRS